MPLDRNLVSGTQFDADVVYFPGSHPQRALVTSRHNPPQPVSDLQGKPIRPAIVDYSRALLLNPWLETFPMLLSGVIPLCDNGSDTGRWAFSYIRDADGDTLPVDPELTINGSLGYLALSGGHPYTLFGEWNGAYFRPLSTLP
jgi:hypothetical protein